MIFNVVCSSSKVTIRIFGCLIWWFCTPLIFLRIAPTLLLAPQEKQPGTVICTILRAASAVLANNARKTKARKSLPIFFINAPHMMISDDLHYVKSLKDATAKYN